MQQEYSCAGMQNSPVASSACGIATVAAPGVTLSSGAVVAGAVGSLFTDASEVAVDDAPAIDDLVSDR